jgi:hypothetical protein
MPNIRLVPNYLFESSWEVCNKVGGIHTVLSTKAATLQRMYPDRVLFIGPDLTGRAPQPAFIESDTLLANWKQQAISEGLSLRIGRWDVPGTPIAILVKFDALYARKERIYTDVWTWFGVDSLHAFGDYDESCMFAWACAEVIHSFIRYKGLKEPGVVAHFDEWTTGMGLLYCKHYLPQVGTVFTTHATSIGRSICGNNLPLYDSLTNYNGDQMARQLNMVSKHSLEKTAAALADCFTTVSDITAHECAALLDHTPDVVTPNGFEPLFVKHGEEAVEARNNARTRLFDVAEALFGSELPEDTLFVGISGRYEFRNKGLDVFVDSLSRVRGHSSLERDVVGVIMVPADVSAPRQEVLERLATIATLSGQSPLFKGPIFHPFLTHWLFNMDNDNLVSLILHRGFTNEKHEKVKLMVVPCYLDGNDGVFNLSYYDLLPGFDLTVFPSYYEPWGYTPLESIAFSIPTITTNLAGFGAWALSQGGDVDISDGVAVLPRSDHNYSDVVNEIALQVVGVSQKSQAEWALMAEQAGRLSELARWSVFIEPYEKAYEIALGEAAARTESQVTPVL